MRRTVWDAGVMVLVALCAGTLGQAAEPTAPPQEILAQDGVLSATLTASEQTVAIDDARFDGMVYNDTYTGPVLRVHPGDVMKLHLVNQLHEPTNLHFHGIKTTPLGNSDNVFIEVAPGKAFDYEIKIPATQPPGLYWYHDHLHTITTRHVSGGLTGALIVEGFTDQFPELAGIKEQLFVLKDILFDGDQGSVISGRLHNLVQSINGRTDLAISMQPGETQLWRFTNQSSDRYFHLALAGHKFMILGDDGAAVVKPQPVDTIDIKPASRIDALVIAGPAGDYPLVSQKVATGEGAARTLSRPLGTLTVAGETVAPRGDPKGLILHRDLADLPVDVSRKIVFSQLNDDEHFMLNGKEYDHNRVDQRVKLGDLEEWTLQNDSDDFHEFHIHQVSYQVTEINGEKQPYNGQVDVVRVPERGQVKIRLAFTDPIIVGRFVYHCHLLTHEDKGMMAMMEVYDPNARISWRGVADYLSLRWSSLVQRCTSLIKSGN